MSTLAGFLWKGVDLGAAPTRLMLVDKRVQLIPESINRTIPASARPGIWDFGTEFGARTIELEVVSGDNASLAGTEIALRAVADALDPTTEAVAGDKAVGQLIFDDEPDRYWLAKLVNGPFPEYLPSAGKLTLTMRCSDPVAYSTAQYVVSGGQATITGFSAYRQAPEKINWNLIKDGAIAVGTGYWTDSGGATWAVVVDATSPTGTAYRLISTGGNPYRYENIPCEAGQAYSAAAWLRSDGTVAAFLDLVWLDAAGSLIREDTSAANATAVWVEKTIVNKIAPGNARTLQVRIYGGVAGISFYAGVRVKQQAGAPAAWSAADQQTVTQKGLAIYEAATNLLTNPDVESALPGASLGFNDALANLNEWALDSGTAFTVAANVVSRAAGDGRMTFGHQDWWDQPSSGGVNSRLRFKWVTGGTMLWYLKWVDVNNWVRLFTDGATFRLTKKIAGSQSDVFSGAAVLVNGNQYWFQPVVTSTNNYTATLDNDAAGAPGANVQTTGAQVISDSQVQHAKMAIEMLGAGMQFGGNFAGVCRVSIYTVTGWAMTTAAGVPSFAITNINRFAGTYSLSVAKVNAGTVGYWQQNAITTAVADNLTASVRIKSANGAKGGIILLDGNGANLGEVDGGVSTDWAPVVKTGVSAANGANAGVQLILPAGSAAGVVWFDNVWFAKQPYDTGNADPPGLAYTTGARTVSALTLPIPAAFDVTDFAAVVTYRPDHAIGGGPTYRNLVTFDSGGNGDHLTIIAPYAGAGLGIAFFKERGAAGAAITSYARDAGASAFAAGDTLAIGARFSTVTGLALWVSKNGGAATKYVPDAAMNAEMLLAVPAPTEIRLGTPAPSSVNGSGYADGTIGVVRILRGGLSDAQLAAVVAAPYAPQDETIELVVWRFEGATVPEDYASGVLSLEVGGTYWTDPDYIDLTAGAAYGPGAVTFTDSNGNVLTWTGSLALNDVLRVESQTLRVRKNGALSMAAVTGGSKWPRFRGGGLRDTVTVTGIPAASVKALTAAYRHRWI
jgi:hypothetical protein